jgi:hypothetical protein
MLKRLMARARHRPEKLPISLGDVETLANDIVAMGLYRDEAGIWIADDSQYVREQIIDGTVKIYGIPVVIDTNL